MSIYDKLLAYAQTYPERVIGTIFAICYSGFFVASILVPQTRLFNNIMFLVAILSVLLIIFVSRIVRTFHSRIPDNFVVIGFFAFIFFIHLILAISLQVQQATIGSDFGQIYRQAVHIASGGSLFSDNVSYFNAYPNNIGILSILTAWLKGWGYLGVHDYQFLTVLLNVCFMNSALWLIYAIIKKLLGGRFAVFGTSLGILFITNSMWSGVYYSDTTGLLFPILILALTMLIKRIWKQPSHMIALSLVIGVVIALGVSVKPTIVFVPISIAIIYMLTRKGRLTVIHPFARPQIYAYIVCLTVGLIIGSAAPNLFVGRYMNLTLDPTPPEHMIMIGLHTDCSKIDTLGCRYGVWNKEDNDTYGKFYYPNRSEYKNYVHNEIINRLKSFGIGGYTGYIINKGSWIISDGVFDAGSYPNDPSMQQKVVNTPTAHAIRSVLSVDGEYSKVYRIFVQIVWTATLLLALMSSFYRQKSLLIIQLSLAFLIVFLLLFEATPRYLYLYVPFFIIAATYGMKNILSNKLHRPSFEELRDLIHGKFKRDATQ